jgi:hypothetical protein
MSILRQADGSITAVEHSPHHPKVKGLSPTTVGEIMVKKYLVMPT